MSTVLDTPERIAHIEPSAIPDLHIEKPRARRARPGFWRTLAHGMTRHLTRTPRLKQTPSYSAHGPFEAPMDRLVREHPSLAPLALAII